MKDSVITAKVKRRELIILLCCFAVANVVNWCAIIKFSTPWYEIFTQVGYIVVTTLVLYGLLLALRVAWWILSGLARKK
ncbi:MAG: hypothetical protein IIW00_04885 [Alistipes sp.]|jgi:hypothetical protein|nr:hypothetical protein [Alistipes sp.]